MWNTIKFGVAVLLLVAVSGCSTPPLRVGAGVKDIEVTPLANYGTLRANLLLSLAGVKDIRSSHRVDCYRIVYRSTDAKGESLQLSGLLALPRDGVPTQLVSFQHGTTSNPEFVPSNLSTDGLAAALVFAGNGYAAIAPDYIGLGVSKRAHPYYVAADTARAVVDMIHAVRHVERVPSGPPLFIGFSEGGYASLAAQRTLEASGETVRATASIAGAFNLRSISIPWTLQGKSAQAPIYMALWIRGYADRYGQGLDTAFAQKYAGSIVALLDKPQDPRKLMQALPRDPRELFLPAVLDAIAEGNDHWLTRAIAENEMGDWPANAPIRFYYGNRDIDVPPEEAIVTAKQLSKHGADVQAIDVGPFEHDPSVLAAAPLILKWFQTMKQ